MRILPAFPTLLLAALLQAFAVQPRPYLTVAAASNVQFAMEEIRSGFSAVHGAEVKAVFSSSGKLAAQIRNGAPFDAFVSADMAYPDSLVKWGHALGEPRAYALGLLVLWTVRPDLDLARGLALLADASILKVALPDPALAPYGREALAAMAKAGVERAVSPKLVYAQSIGQTSQFIVTGSVDIGFNAKSVVASPGMKGKGKWIELDRSSYRPVPQGAVLLKHGAERNPALSAKFLDYLHSPQGRGILARYGYLLP